MGQFFKFVLASCLGIFIAMLLLFGVGIMVLAGIASSAEKPVKVSPNTVLRITLEKPVPEKTNNLEMATFDLKETKVLGLSDILKLIEKAKNDDNIKGILLETDMISTGLSTASVLREAILDFKSSGKFVIAYSDYYSQGAYFMASAADQVFVNPLGGVDFIGFAAEVPFFKNMLDKLGIKAQVYYAGKFKSATEPFRRTNMSDENRLQTRAYLDEIYRIFLDEISRSRGVSVGELRKVADTNFGLNADEAKKFKLVDAIGYRDEALSLIRQKMGLDADDKIRTTTLEDYFKSSPISSGYSGKNKIAVVYAEGTLVDGKGEYGSIGDDRYVKIIEKIRKDDDIKAMVLRVNSPGGSAMSSENIWREMTLLKQAGKPIVVSMGDYAASGGYYIACIGDSIVAEPNTITGSIGVFSLIPSVQRLMNDKIGINFDTVKTAKFAQGLSILYDMSEEEGRMLQVRTDQIYETFLKRVSEGRGMSRDQVHEIAQGRVWTGTKAKQLGLVDELGGLDKALEIAAGMAGLEDYRTTEYPRTKDPIEQLLEEFTNTDTEEVQMQRILKTQLNDWYPYYKMLKEMQDSKGIQARMPHIIKFN